MCSDIERCVLCALSMGALFFILGKNMEFTKENLKEINVYSLRSLARQIGVKSPTTLNKDALINEIIEIKSGKKEPYFSSKVGRPTKAIVKLEDMYKKESLLSFDKVEIQKEIKQQLISSILKEIEKKLNEII